MIISLLLRCWDVKWVAQIKKLLKKWNWSLNPSQCIEALFCFWCISQCLYIITTITNYCHRQLMLCARSWAGFSHLIHKMRLWDIILVQSLFRDAKKWTAKKVARLTQSNSSHSSHKLCALSFSLLANPRSLYYLLIKIKYIHGPTGIAIEGH